MSDKMRKLARDHFSVLIEEAMNAEKEGKEEEKQKYLKEVNSIAAYVMKKYSLEDFAFVVGAA